jgi:hypothetical protein
MARLGVSNESLRQELKVHTSIVFRCDVVGQIVIQNETQQSVEESEINLLIYLGQYSFHEHVTFTVTGFPDIGQIVNALTPLQMCPRSDQTICRSTQSTNLVNKERRRFCVRWLYPCREQPTFVGPIHEIKKISYGHRKITHSKKRN